MKIDIRTVWSGADFSIIPDRKELAFFCGGEEMLRITSSGELIFTKAAPAAEALLREWKKLQALDPAKVGI